MDKQNNSIVITKQPVLMRQNGVIALPYGIKKAVVAHNDEEKTIIHIDFLSDEHKQEVQEIMYSLISHKNIRLSSDGSPVPLLRIYGNEREIDDEIQNLRNQIKAMKIELIDETIINLDSTASTIDDNLINYINNQIESSEIFKEKKAEREKAKSDYKDSDEKEIKRLNENTKNYNIHYDCISSENQKQLSQYYRTIEEIEILNKKLSFNTLKERMKIDDNGNLTILKQDVRDESIRSSGLIRELAFAQEDRRKFLENKHHGKEFTDDVTNVLINIIECIEPEHGTFNYKNHEPVHSLATQQTQT